MWLYCKWKEVYDCPYICCNCYVYNFKVIAYQIVLHHCAQIISLNQMIWSSMLMTSKTNQLSWYKSSSKVLKILLFSTKIENQTWYSWRFQWHCSWFNVAGLMWLIVCDNYSLNPFNYRLPLVIWLIYCLRGYSQKVSQKHYP